MGVRPTPDGHIHLINPAGRKVWGTDEPPVQLVRDAWQEIPISIEFPDFPKDIAYWFQRASDGFGGWAYYGTSFVKMLPQELTLPDIVLGQVPSSLVNYVDWRVNLNWAKKPSNVIGLPVSSSVAEGKEVDLRGGSALLEYSMAYCRMVHIRLEGRDIVLSRRQSSSHDDAIGSWRTNVQDYGWTYGISRLGAIVSYRGQSTINRGQYLWGAYRNGSNSAPMNDNTDYSSTWTGTLYVKPGRANATI